MVERKQEIEKAKKRYELLKKEKEELVRIKAELQDSIQKLEQDEKVKKYLELKQRELSQEETPSDSELMSISFWDVDKNILDRIYYYEGSYIKAKEKQDHDQYTAHMEVADYVVYRNISDFRDDKRITVARKKHFERNHVVVKALAPTEQLSKKIYDELANYYFELLLTAEDNEIEIVKKLKQRARKI